MYKLIKAWYGLLQAPRAWNARLDKCLKELSFNKCMHELVVYTKVIIVGVYFDDLLVIGFDKREVEDFKLKMSKQFEMTNLELLSFYLGIEVSQEKMYTMLKQSPYAKKLLERSGMLNCNPSKYRMEHKFQLDKDEVGKTHRRY